jgi:hypothetical protein
LRKIDISTTEEKRGCISMEESRGDIITIKVKGGYIFTSEEKKGDDTMEERRGDIIATEKKRQETFLQLRKRERTLQKIDL